MKIRLIKRQFASQILNCGIYLAQIIYKGNFCAISFLENMKFQKVKKGFFLLLIIYLIMLTGFRCQETRGVEEEDPNNMENAKIKLYTQNDQNTQTPQWMCPCLNGGSCYSPGLNHLDTQNPNNIFCHCRSSYIGQLCERRASYLPVESDIYQLIKTTQYKYFYYQPKQENAYSFSFHICFAEPNQDVINSTSSQGDIIEKAITFFFMIEHLNGTLELNETENQPETIILYRDQCKHIYADYTTFSKTKSQQIQKLVLAIKLGYKLRETKTGIIIFLKNDIPNTSEKNNTLKYNIDSQIMDKNNSKLKYIINSTINKRYTKEFLRTHLNNKETRLVYIDFNISVLSVEQVLDNVLYCLATVMAFFIVAGLIFLLRTKILGMRLNESLNSEHGLVNNIKHFEKFMPPQSFRLEDSANMNSEEQDEDQKQCVICLLAFADGENVRRTPCDHIFHKQCIDSWCTHNLTCPVCRRSLTQKNLKLIDQPSLLEIRTNSDSNDSL